MREPIGCDLADAVVVDECGDEHKHVEYLMRLALWGKQTKSYTPLVLIIYTKGCTLYAKGNILVL